MLPIYICDDSETQLNRITKIINNYIIIEDLDMKVVCSTKNPYELLNYLETHKETSLYFLDVDFNCDINGLQLGKEIRKIDPRGFIVFITSHHEMSIKTFHYKLEAMDFIIKDNVKSFDEKIIKCLLYAYKLFSSKEITNQQIISIKIKNKIISIPKDKIFLIQSIPNNPHYIRIIGDEIVYSFHGSLNDIQKQLGDSFYRCEKSVIVNMDNILKIDKKDHIIYLPKNITAPISIRNCNKFVNSYMKYKQLFQ